MKNWFKKKLISFLGIDLIKKEVKEVKEENERLKSKLNKLNSLNEKILEENSLIMKQFNLSADIYHYENHSWAVISIQGKPEYVKFVNLSNQDMRSVHSFLKQFEKTNRTIDSPLIFLKD